MTKIYSCNKQGSINGDWFPLWSFDENGYVTKLMFCEHIKELDNSPGFIVSVYDRLSMKVVKMTCVSEEDMLRSAIVPINIEIKPREEQITLNMIPKEIER